MTDTTAGLIDDGKPEDAFTGIRVLRASHTRLLRLQGALAARTGLRQTMSQALEFALNAAEEQEKKNVIPDAS